MQNQFETLQPWLPRLLEGLKREIKTEHLSKNPLFYRSYFGTRPLNRLTTEEIVAAYQKELIQGNEELSEWIVNRWVFNHGEIYEFFAERLAKINPDFSQIQNLDDAQSDAILDGAAEKFGALETYFFAKLNGVVFPEATFVRLRKSAEEEEAKTSLARQEAETEGNLQQQIQRYKRENERIQERCDSRIAGVMRKYATDIEALKRQIRALQQRVQ